jgi:proteic killer suppression protein
VIVSFGDRATEDSFNGDQTARVRGFPVEVREKGPRKLDLINAAAKLDDLRVPPGNRLEALKGDLAGYYSIRINGQWRVVFKWKDGAAHEVRIDDYH